MAKSFPVMRALGKFRYSQANVDRKLLNTFKWLEIESRYPLNSMRKLSHSFDWQRHFEFATCYLAPGVTRVAHVLSGVKIVFNSQTVREVSRDHKLKFSVGPSANITSPLRSVLMPI